MMPCNISLVAIKAVKMSKVYSKADDGQQAIRKAHLSFQLKKLTYRSKTKQDQYFTTY